MGDTATDRTLDEIVKICRDVKSGNQIHALWKVFNIMTGFIKTQANLINEMDKRIKKQETELNRLKDTVARFLTGDKHVN